MLVTTMLTKLCAIALLVLALSPFTAPFQTCTLADWPNGSTTDEAVMVTPPPLAPAPLADDAGAVISPLATAMGRLKLAPVSGLIIANVVMPSSRVSVLLPIASARRLCHHLVPPTLLRV
jgi:hypothetical protein